MKTANGVYYNLKESDYFYDLDGMRFYFSSRFYQAKFESQAYFEIKRFNAALKKVYKNKFDINMSQLALIRLYTMIEKRGFYIIVREDEVTCVEDLAFVGTVTFKNRSEN